MIICGVSMAGNSRDDQKYIEFDGVYLDPKFSLLVNDLKSRGITSLNDVRQTAIFSYVKEKKLCPAKDTHAFVREFRTLTNPSDSGIRPFRKWDDALAKKVPVSKLLGKQSAALCEANNVKTLYDLMMLPKNNLSIIFQKNGEIEAILSNISKLPIGCLDISPRVVNILLRTGIQKEKIFRISN